MTKEAVSRLDLAPYREILVAERKRLLGELTGESSRLMFGGRVAEDDQPPLLHDQFVALREQSIAYETLKLIESALDRLRMGEFGICLGCSEDIPARRLAAVPWAEYCIACQERAAQEADQRAA